MSDCTVPEHPKKAAFVALLGRPSTGKSTLVNRLCGERVAIVSKVPQTTRNAIRGIVNRERGQLVLIDTPGIHDSEKKFNRHLSDTAFRAAAEADMILYVLDASRAPGPEEEAIAAGLAGHTALGGKAASGEGGGFERCAASLDNAAAKSPGGSPRLPLIAAVNKMDLSAADFERAAEFIRSRFPSLPQDRIIPISAQKNEGIDTLLSTLFDLAPSGDAFYPEDYYTDQEIDFRIAEVIRGEALRFLRQELPHSIYVDVADRELRARQDGADTGTQRLWVRAFIICERESQKGMIVGKGGNIIKAIGKASRKELNRIFDWSVELDLRVKTGKDWRHNDGVLRKIFDR